jgi:hypothetical protein
MHLHEKIDKKKPSPEPEKRKEKQLNTQYVSSLIRGIVCHNQDIPAYSMAKDQIIVPRTTHRACTSICMVVYPGLS